MMRFVLLLIFGALTVGVNAIDADQTRIKEYELVTVSHEVGEKLYATFNYEIRDSKGSLTSVERRVLPETHFARGETKTTFTGPPGMYEISVGKPLFIEISREGRPDPPPPIPDPIPDDDEDDAPNPPPVPDTDKLKVGKIFFIEEINDRNVNPQYLAFTNTSFKTMLQVNKGIEVVILDDDQPAVVNWVTLANGEIPFALFYESKDKYKIVPLAKDLTVLKLNAIVEGIVK